ncbi:MAG: mechanosensitive ion channel family protein [Gemmatimonadaceae bacterium]|nr:mechanosensitive ion channel family protein [Chitinophagaceae bacterium]
MYNWLDIIGEKLARWWIHFIKILPNILLALLVLVVFYLIARWTRKLLFRLSIRISGKVSVSNLFSTVTQVVILFIGLFIVLDILQLDKAVSSLLAGAGIIGLALGFAFQDLSSNFISGVFIAFKKPFEVGHTVETNSFIGNIEEIQLRSTTIRTFSGLHLMIPNKDIFQKPMINYSLTADRRIEFNLAISYTSDLTTALDAAIAAVNTIPYLHKERKPEVYFTGFGENSIKMSIWVWIYNHLPPGYMVAQHDVVLSVTNAFKQNDISLVVPITFQGLEKIS